MSSTADAKALEGNETKQVKKAGKNHSRLWHCAPERVYAPAVADGIRFDAAARQRAIERRDFLTAGFTRFWRAQRESEEMRSVSCEKGSGGNDSLLNFFISNKQGNGQVSPAEQQARKQ